MKIPCSGHSAMKRGNHAAWRPATSGQGSVTTNADAPALFGTLRLLVAEMLPISSTMARHLSFEVKYSRGFLFAR